MREPDWLLDRLRYALRTRHYSLRTEDAYVRWARRFILFHGKRHPDEMGAEKVVAFLTWLATERQVSASNQNQALSALLFLYPCCCEESSRGSMRRCGPIGCGSCPACSRRTRYGACCASSPSRTPPTGSWACCSTAAACG